MKDLLHFDSMITPKIITFVYWLLLIVIAIGGLIGLIGAFGTMRYSLMKGLGALLTIPLGTIAAALLARIYCEILIVLFKMNEALQELRNSGSAASRR